MIIIEIFIEDAVCDRLEWIPPLCLFSQYCGYFRLYLYIPAHTTIQLFSPVQCQHVCLMTIPYN